ncbi:glycoside hydrolase family 13 protein [Enterococcus hermanniensis]|uniref:Alpha-amylase n=1 Tax=Enterococcus hermanniensis TaxID=249189 RepID=A0A1L8TQ13_9ENTE|nr:alpha-glucosidase [Enterococcus hermanniensis]OJG46268.1 alpha-glucosidase [Enterococcus hermanniensis]
MTKWWKNAVGYQIYPRSFMDSNNDGIGDIKGIQSKLPYLKELGIDFIWINPIYKSPNIDNGYDISDYKSINPEFGTLDDLKELLHIAHEHNIKIIMDLVINHTSDQHPWFIEAKKSIDNPYRNFYLWADATPEKMPNDWQGFFGGSTWTYDSKTKQAYFHIFTKGQPDLNWKNSEMRTKIYQRIKWWLDFGIDGFRLDAISHIQKEPWDFKIKTDPWAPFSNVSGIEHYMTELKDLFHQYNIMTVGEASGVKSKQAAFWTNEDNGYIDMIFELEQLKRTGDLGKQTGDLLALKEVLSRWQVGLKNSGWNALYIENHDNPRSNSIFGNETPASATALATAYMLLKGTPFIYQGREIGMTNYPFSSIDELRATDSLMAYQNWLDKDYTSLESLKLTTNWARDHARTPMQWGASGAFSKSIPWMKINPNADQINVESQQKDPSSTLNYYKKLIKLKKELSVFTDGNYKLELPKHPKVWAYTRTTAQEKAKILVNLSEKVQVVTLPNRWLQAEYKIILTNYPEQKLTKVMTLRPFEAIVISNYML